MCGICGFNWKDKELLDGMMKVLHYRGPDGSGIYEDNHISLGHLRLSIIDLSELGKQPMCNEDGTIWVIFNGEIYNFKELRGILENKHKFVSNSDTETIIHAYEEYGNAFVKKLRGMFALAIWDTKRKKLILARDRLGKKPLYYHYANNRFIFASEIKAILQDESIERKVSPSALYSYLTYRFSPGNFTMFEGIMKLQPGHLLIFEKSEITVEPYWDIEYSQKNDSVENYCKNIMSLLEESVRLRMISDVPLGAYLSGGLDSSAIVALMSQSGERVRTFSVGFGNSNLSELKYANIVAKKFGTEHHELDVDMNSLDVLPRIVWHLDEPLADASCIPLFLMSELTNKYVKVILSGEGSDEIFAGYDKYKPLYYGGKFGIIAHMAKAIPKIFGNRRTLNIASSLGNRAENYLELVSVFNSTEKKRLLGSQMQAEGFDISPFFDGNKDHLWQLLYLDLKTWLPEDLLLKNDKMTMAHSLEARLPFLDHHLVEYAMSIPSSYKLHYLKEKYIYRKAIKGMIPQKILRRKKQGFSVPIKDWATGGLRQILLNLSDENECLDKKYCKKIAGYSLNSIYEKRQFWSVLSFLMWHKIFIQDSGLKTPDLKLKNYL